MAVQRTPSKPTVAVTMFTDENTDFIRRIEPHTGSPLWIIINEGQYLSRQVRAWAWTDADGEGVVYHGPLTLFLGVWTPASDDAPHLFDSEQDADAFITSTLT